VRRPELTSPGETTDPSAPCVAQFGRAVASKSKGGWPANKVFCFGHEDIGRLNEILAFYAADDLEPTFYGTDDLHARGRGGTASSGIRAGARMRWRLFDTASGPPFDTSSSAMTVHQPPSGH